MANSNLSPDLAQLTLALRQIDPTARLAGPTHDTIEVICAHEHAYACAELVRAFVERASAGDNAARTRMKRAQFSRNYGSQL